MKTTHSIDHELLNEIVIVANTEMLRCDLNLDLEPEVIEKMARSLVIDPEPLLSKSKEPCLLHGAESVNGSVLTNGYSLTLDDIRGVLFHSHKLHLIFKKVNPKMTLKEALNFYNDLADLAGYHVLMYDEDFLDDIYLDYFNERKLEFFDHQVTQTELRLLYFYYCFASKLIDWREEANCEEGPRLKLIT